MKKLSFLLAMAFAFSMALAQNTAVTTQSGDNQNAVTTQTGSNDATVTQSTDDNFIQNTTVTQIGGTLGKNTAAVIQLETGVGSTNSANNVNVQQNGSLNNAYVSQSETGGGNKGALNTSINQTGESNTSMQTSVAPGSSSGHNLIGIQDGTGNILDQSTTGGYTKTMRIEQDGLSNYAAQRGYGSTHTDAKIFQDGTSNIANQDINGSNNGYGSAVIQIDQKGDNNDAMQDFAGSGSSHKNNAEIYQDNEFASTTVGNWAGQIGSGRNLNAETSQMGDDNFAETEQYGEANSAVIYQIGNENTIGKRGETVSKGVLQDGSNNSFVLTQSGDNNRVSQFRTLTDVYASVKQEGDDNIMAIVQTGNGHVVGEGSFPYNGIDQVGNSNLAYIEQSTGHANKLGIFHQSGDENYAQIQQLGNNNIINTAKQVKLGGVVTNNSLIILQDGDGNKITNASEEGLNIIGSILQDGDNNEAAMQLSRTNAFGDIDQLGDDNKATLTINKSYIGNNNSGIIYQDGDKNEAVARIGQNDPATTSSDNYMKINQVGDWNDSDIFVEGSLNDAQIIVSGSYNIGAISQTGNSNIGLITQTGSYNTASITQTGL